jgi:hypothetical protein
MSIKFKVILVPQNQMKNSILVVWAFLLIFPIAHAFDRISSYQNAKHPPFYSETFPLDSWGRTPQLAEARAFFKYADGNNGLIANEHGYQTHNHTLQQAKPGIVNFYVMKDSAWVKADVKINYKSETCIHARKIISADFNNDNVIDFAFMCQGYDAMPFPGEKMKILLSKSNHEYDFQVLHDDIDFFHGGASEDFNGDGLPDLFVGTMHSPKLYLNIGDGKFKYEKTYSQIKRAFSIELVDVNGDGKFDIVSGAHEWETPTTIYLNKGSNDFGYFDGLTIPPVPGAGNVLDFIVSKNDNCLYIMRTGGEKGNRAVWYKGVFIQKLCGKSSEVIYGNKDWVDPTRKSYKFTSMRWMIESEGELISDWGRFLRVPIK